MPAASFASSDATASHRLAEKRRWIARSSSSDVPCRYASIRWPVPVVRSVDHVHSPSARCFLISFKLTDVLVQYIVPPLFFFHTKIFFFLAGFLCYSPGNLRRSMDLPFVVRCSVSNSVCVVLPDRSRPSMTINAPRVMIASAVVDDFQGYAAYTVL